MKNAASSWFRINDFVVIAGDSLMVMQRFGIKQQTSLICSDRK